MNNLPLQPLKWEDREDSAMVTTVFRGYWVTSDKESKGKFCAYYGSSSGEPARGFATIEDAKRWAEYEHYAGEMQPYVKPLPSKVYELTYDYGDGYSTLFMTLDKQLAVDFMESVKKHDEQFICDTSYDAYEVETIHDLYNDNHPLAPYKDKIFNSIYEDSFSEWMLNYGSNSFVSSLDVIEHELFSTMQNLHKGD